jgi:hypothetical protein
VSLLDTGWALLQSHRFKELAALEITSELPPGSQGRLWAWKATALEELQAFTEARAAAMQAIRLAKQAEETDALPSLRALYDRISASMLRLEAVQAEALKDLALTGETPENLIQGQSPEEAAERLLRQAAAFLASGNREAAEHSAKLAIALRPPPRPAVMARLFLARLASDPEALVLDAWKIADAADDQGLITAAAQAAKLHRVVIPTPVF